jgi:hypothetical protein
MVAVLLVYNIRVDESSFIIVIQLKIAPEIMPGIIAGIVTLKKVGSCEYPKLIDASSIFGLICLRIAELDRTVYAILRITYAIMIMAAVPLRIIGPELYVINKIRPKIVPGITYGNITKTSKIFENIFFLRTVR